MRLYLIGGFLGSGKTTAIHHACKLLKQQDVGVGVITNDQGVQLVDTAFLDDLNVPVQEVIKGCFCCNYKDLEACIKSLSGTHQPNILFAESVGSCTDLVATVVNPLLQFHPVLEIVVSVFADALVLLQKKNKKQLFADEVQYIFNKQLEEADVLVVSKIDLLEEHQLEELKEYLHGEFPAKNIVYQNSLDRGNVQHWLSCLSQFRLRGKRKTLELNYDVYGEGEAKLAWLDEELEILSIDKRAVEAGLELIKKVHSKIKIARYPIGHLKFLMNDGKQKRKISFVSGDHHPVPFTHESSERIKLLVNARVQTEPPILREILTTAIAELKAEMHCRIIEHKGLAFKPGFPKPAFRLVS